MASSESIEDLRVQLAIYRTEYALGQHKWLFRSCELAFEALERGDYGVGAVLVNQRGERLAEASNQVFSQGFNSSAHAEMQVLDQFERTFSDYSDRENLTLISSLEPCPMCTGRILFAGIGKIVFLAKDSVGGMLSHCEKLPEAWRNLSQLTKIQVSSSEPELSMLASDIASAQLPELREKLLGFIRP